MRIVKPNGLAGARGNRSPSRPDWFTEWLQNQGKWALLECDCIEDVHMPKCVTLLTGKNIMILCPFVEEHGFVKIKKTLKLRDVLKARGILIPEDLDPKGLYPPPF